MSISLITQHQWNTDKLLVQFEEQLRRNDLLRLQNTRTYGGLKQVYALEQNNNYLFREMNIKFKKVLFRIRMETNILYIEDKKIMIDPNNDCTWCNAMEQENWAHVLFNCDYLKTIREKMNLKQKQRNMESTVMKAGFLTSEEAFIVYKFLYETAQQRTLWQFQNKQM